MKHGVLLTRKHLLGQATLAVVLSYAVFAALWILLSDSAVEALFKEPEQIIRVSMLKGWLFVAVTTLLLFVLVKRQIRLLNEAHQREIESYQARQHTHDLLSAIVDNSDDAIFAKDPEGRYLLINNAASRMVGKPVAEVLGNDDRHLFPPEQADRLLAIGQRIMAHGHTETNEENLDTKLGTRVFLATKGPLRDANRTITGTFGISRDITERKQSERILEESESRFRALVEQSAAGIYIVQDNRFCYVNPYFAQLARYDSPQEMIEHVQFMDLVVPEQRAMIADKLRRRLTGDTSDNHYNVTGLRRDGSRIEVELHGNIIEYHGRPALIGLFIDVTARETAQRELRASEEFKRAILDSVSDHIAVIDRTGQILAVNAPWHRFARENDLDEEHFTQQAGVGSNYLDICHASHGLSADGAISAEAGIRAVLAGTSSKFTLEYPCHSPGVQRWFIMNVTPMGEENLGAVIAHTNITARKLAEEGLRARNEELERFNRATVGREMDMIELKQRINALSLELSRAAPYDLGFMEPGTGQSEASRGR